MSFLKRFVPHSFKDVLIDAFIVCVVLFFISVGAALLWVSTLNLPDLSAFEERRVEQSTKIYDSTGEIVLYDLFQDVKRTVVSYDHISRHIKNATVAIEDDTFFEHNGIRPLAILNAILDNLKGGNLLSGRGGSTITQQVIKNSLLERDKTITRKVKEWILAIRLEQVLTKEEILGHYLNESPYGGTIYGVEEASQAFFGKTAADVTLAEAAYLASLPQLPSYYSPYGANKAELDARKNLVLDQMYKNGFISPEELAGAQAEIVEFRPQIATGIKAPHFVFYIRDYLAEKYGEEYLAERGLKVITTLDWELQQEAEKIVKEKALANETKFNAENGALVAIDPQTGHILVMVGSRDYFDKDIDGNFNIAIADRQPGSSFKPFVYATALKKGYTPETVVFDLKTQFSTACAPDNQTSENGCYSPNNYDGKFRGPVNLRNALAQSLNIPAVKVLYLAGINDSLKLARDLGITTLTDPKRYGLTLVLGGGEVKLLDMVSAYGVFANEGVRNTSTGILKIEDAEGNTLEEFKENEKRVIDRDVTLMISNILTDNTARTPLYGANSLLYFPGRDVAAKTGTTNDKRDAWIIGYTPNLAVGAWAGNNDNRSMNELSGLIIAPMWRAFMDVALKKFPEKDFNTPPKTPENLKPVLRGLWFDPAALITQNNNQNSEDESPLNLENSILGSHDILHFVQKDDPRGPYPSNPGSDSQYELWEYPVTLWKNELLNATGSTTSERRKKKNNDTNDN
jgi:1A family penicillin-binding protein